MADYNRKVALQLAMELRTLVVAYVESIAGMPDEPAVMNPLCRRLGKIVRELTEPGSILEFQ